jgi:glycosyltransferase involved in cell wall biosynthesis
MATPRSSSPLVSVVIPCFNQGRFLADAIESVGSQPFEVEIIAVNDGSADDTERVACRYPAVRLVSQPHRGLAAARNAGFRASHGQVLVFLDADDRLLPGAIEAGLALLERQPGIAAAVGRSQIVDEQGVWLETVHRRPTDTNQYRAFLENNYIRMPAMVMFRRRTIELVGGFDSRVSPCADYDLYLRIVRRVPMGWHDAVVAEYRRHEAAMSFDPGLMLTAVTRVFEMHAPLVRRDPSLRAAWRRGLHLRREYYGGQLVNEIRAAIRRPARWGRMVRSIGYLLRHDPGALLTHARRKLAITMAEQTGLRGRDPSDFHAPGRAGE